MNILRAQAVETPTPHFLQMHLIPKDASLVREEMHLAAKYAQSTDFCTSHFLSALHGLKAVAVCFFNTAAYLFRSIGHAFVHIVDMNYSHALREVCSDLVAAVQSLGFALFGMGYVAAGVIAPREVFSFFDPHEIQDYSFVTNERLQELLFEANAHRKRLEKELYDLKNPIQEQKTEK